MKKLLLTVGFSLLVIGCISEETKSIEFYKENPEEAEKVVIECNKKTATISENCKNAKLGLTQRMFTRPKS